MPDLTDHYERPLGAWAQRIAGGVLVIAIGGAAWALGPYVVIATKGVPTGEALAWLAGIVATLWLALLAIRLMRAKPASGGVLPPFVLIAFGVVIVLALSVSIAMSLAEHLTILTAPEIFEGSVLAAGALAVGLRRRRRGNA